MRRIILLVVFLTGLLTASCSKIVRENLSTSSFANGFSVVLPIDKNLATKEFLEG